MSEDSTVHRRRRVQPPTEQPQQVPTQTITPDAPQRKRENRPIEAAAASPQNDPRAVSRTYYTPLNEPQNTVPTPAVPFFSDETEDSEEKPRKHTQPKHVMVGAFIIALCCIALYTGDLLMKSWLRDRSEERAAAEQRVLDNHPLSYRAWIEEYADTYNLQPAYVAAIILNESSFRPSAESSVGARGLMQLMPETAAEVGKKIGDTDYSFDLMYDPEQNIRYGCWYLQYECEKFGGDPVLVTAAYHAGHGTVQNWLNDTGISKDGKTIAIDDLPDGPTKTYVRKVMKAYGIYQTLYFEQASADDSTASGDASADAASIGI